MNPPHDMATVCINRRVCFLILSCLLFVPVYADDHDLWDSMDYIVYSDSAGLWLIDHVMLKKLLYPLSDHSRIEDIVILPEADQIIFVDSYTLPREENVRDRLVTRVWRSTHFRYIPDVNRPQVFTITGQVERRSSSYLGETYSRLIPSSSGRYVIAQRQTMEREDIGYEIFEHVGDNEWMMIQTVDQWSWRLPLGWDSNEQKSYDLGLSGDLLHGLSIVNVITGEGTILDGIAAAAVSSLHDLLMTFPTSYGDGSVQNIEFYRLTVPRQLKNSRQERVNGTLLRQHIAWNPVEPIVLCPFEVRTRSGYHMEVLLLSPNDSLCKRLSIPGIISDVEWLPSGDGILYSSGCQLFRLITSEGKSEHIRLNDDSIQVVKFAVKWR